MIVVGGAVVGGTVVGGTCSCADAALLVTSGTAPRAPMTASFENEKEIRRNIRFSYSVFAGRAAGMTWMTTTRARPARQSISIAERCLIRRGRKVKLDGDSPSLAEDGPVVFGPRAGMLSRPEVYEGVSHDRPRTGA